MKFSDILLIGILLQLTLIVFVLDDILEAVK